MIGQERLYRDTVVNVNQFFHLGLGKFSFSRHFLRELFHFLPDLHILCDCRGHDVDDDWIRQAPSPRPRDPLPPITITLHSNLCTLCFCENSYIPVWEFKGFRKLKYCISKSPTIVQSSGKVADIALPKLENVIQLNVNFCVWLN